ncbi:MAG: class I SAM-dependent methyltransferase [Desulforhabdus sp.]|jgi:predicted RNA methylase|nr:class I SAM-dependent methyltransferase [Desulforhabdus sp.]
MILIKRILQSISKRGMARTFESFVSVLEDFLFDATYKTDTAGFVQLEDMDINDEDKKHSILYQPTRIRHFNNLMKTLDFPERSVFVDLGSGKGRILLLASKFNFKRIIGIEISSSLCEIARKNIAIYKKHSNSPLSIVVVQSNVLQHDIENDENIFYCFRPFDVFVMEKYIRKITNSYQKNPRQIWVIINASVYDDLFKKEPLFHKSLELSYGGADFVTYVTEQ